MSARVRAVLFVDLNDFKQVNDRASVGIAMCEPGRIDAGEVLPRAHLARYDAKRTGEPGSAVFLADVGRSSNSTTGAYQGVS